MSEEPHAQTDVLANPSLGEPSALGASAMGGVAVETEPEQSEFARLTKGLFALTNELADKNIDQQKKIKKIERYFTDNGLRKAVQEGNYDTAELSDFIDALGDINDKTNYILTSALVYAKSSALEELYKGNHTNLLWLLRVDVDHGLNNPNYYNQAVHNTEMIVKGVEGRAIDWLDKAKKSDRSLPWALKELVDDPHFPTACVGSEFNRITEESTGDTVQDQLKIRDAETALLEAFGVPKEMADDFRRSLRARTLPQPNSSQESENTGGIVREKWIANMGDYCKNARTLGASDIETLHRICGLVNLDRYSPDMLLNQLQLLDRLSGGQGPEIPKDITVVFADAFGDYNGAANDLYKEYDPRSTFVFEIHKPEDIKRYQDLIKQMNIKPSTLILDTHGGKGALLHNEGQDAFFVISYDSNDPKTTHVSTLGLGRFIAQDMQPDSVSGEREVLLYVCYGAEGKENIDSMAEAIIKQTEPEDKAVVKAAEGSVGIGVGEAAGGEVFTRSKKPGYRRRLSNYARRLARRGPKDWEIAPTVEHRRGTRPGEVVKSRPAKGTLVRRNQYAR